MGGMTGSSGYSAPIGSTIMLLFWLACVGVLAVIVGLGFAAVWLFQHVRLV